MWWKIGSVIVGVAMGFAAYSMVAHLHPALGVAFGALAFACNVQVGWRE